MNLGLQKIAKLIASVLSISKRRKADADTNSLSPKDKPNRRLSRKISAEVLLDEKLFVGQLHVAAAYVPTAVLRQVMGIQLNAWGESPAGSSSMGNSKMIDRNSDSESGAGPCVKQYRGAVVIMDVSGFTKMCDDYARGLIPQKLAHALKKERRESKERLMQQQQEQEQRRKERRRTSKEKAKSLALEEKGKDGEKPRRVSHNSTILNGARTVRLYRRNNVFDRSGHGAESVREILNAVFADLIAVIEQHNGDVLRIAGDAIIVIFNAENVAKGTSLEDAVEASAQLAALCAWAAVQGEHAASLGLDVHAGCATGTLYDFHVGGDQMGMQLVVCGEPFGQVSEAVDISRHGELVVTEELFGTLQKCGWRGIPSVDKNNNKCPGYVTISSRGTSSQLPDLLSLFESAALRPDLLDAFATNNLGKGTQITLRNYVPLPVLGSMWMDSVGEMQQTKKISVLFGIMDFSMSGAPSQLLEQLQARFSRLQAVCSRLGGVIKEFSVDDKGMVLVVGFGFDLFQGRHPAVRACLCALEAEVEMAECKQEMHFGITTGPVFCASLGSEARKEFAMVSDTVNMAARLMCAAKKPGTWQVTQSTSLDQQHCKSFVKVARSRRYSAKQSSAMRAVAAVAFEAASPAFTDRRRKSSSRSSLDNIQEGRNLKSSTGSTDGIITDISPMTPRKNRPGSKDSSTVSTAPNIPTKFTPDKVLKRRGSAFSCGVGSPMMSPFSPGGGEVPGTPLSLASQNSTTTMNHSRPESSSPAEPLSLKRSGVSEELANLKNKSSVDVLGIHSRHILVDEATYQAAKSSAHLSFQELKPITVKGKSVPLQIYSPGMQTSRKEYVADGLGTAISHSPIDMVYQAIFGKETPTNQECKDERVSFFNGQDSLCNEQSFTDRKNSKGSQEDDHDALTQVVPVDVRRFSLSDAVVNGQCDLDFDSLTKKYQKQSSAASAASADGSYCSDCTLSTKSSISLSSFSLKPSTNQLIENPLRVLSTLKTSLKMKRVDVTEKLEKEKFSKAEESRLSLEAFQTLLPLLLGDALRVEEEVEDIIWIRTQGNPVKMREMALHLKHQKLGYIDEHRWWLWNYDLGSLLEVASLVPGGLQDAYSEKISALSLTNKLVLKAVSVAGSGVKVQMLSHMLMSTQPECALWLKKLASRRSSSSHAALQTSTSHQKRWWDTEGKKTGNNKRESTTDMEKSSGDMLYRALEMLEEEGFLKVDLDRHILNICDLMMMDEVYHQMPVNTRLRYHIVAAEYIFTEKEALETAEGIWLVPKLVHHFTMAQEEHKAAGLLMALQMFSEAFLEDWMKKSLLEWLTAQPWMEVGNSHHFLRNSRGMSCALPWLRGIAKAKHGLQVGNTVIQAALGFRGLVKARRAAQQSVGSVGTDLHQVSEEGRLLATAQMSAKMARQASCNSSKTQEGSPHPKSPKKQRHQLFRQSFSSSDGEAACDPRLSIGSGSNIDDDSGVCRKLEEKRSFINNPSSSSTDPDDKQTNSTEDHIPRLNIDHDNGGNVARHESNPDTTQQISTPPSPRLRFSSPAGKIVWGKKNSKIVCNESNLNEQQRFSNEMKSARRGTLMVNSSISGDSSH